MGILGIPQGSQMIVGRSMVVRQRSREAAVVHLHKLMEENQAKEPHNVDQ